MKQPVPGASLDGTRDELHHRMVELAVRVLERALMEQVRPPLGMYVHPSSAENAAFERAILVICGEAHRLDLRAEELLVALKKAWAQLALIRARHLGDRDGDVLQSLVSNAIEVFFAARDARAHATGHEGAHD